MAALGMHERPDELGFGVGGHSKRLLGQLRRVFEIFASTGQRVSQLSGETRVRSVVAQDLSVDSDRLVVISRRVACVRKAETDGDRRAILRITIECGAKGGSRALRIARLGEDPTTALVHRGRRSEDPHHERTGVEVG